LKIAGMRDAGDLGLIARRRPARGGVEVLPRKRQRHLRGKSCGTTVYRMQVRGLVPTHVLA
jgi:hypothetical protein